MFVDVLSVTAELSAAAFNLKRLLSSNQQQINKHVSYQVIKY